MAESIMKTDTTIDKSLVDGGTAVPETDPGRRPGEPEIEPEIDLGDDELIPSHHVEDGPDSDEYEFDDDDDIRDNPPPPKD